MKFDITEQHIRNASPGSTMCPAACAVREQFPDKDVSVCHHSILIGENLYLTPPHLKDFIYKYDTYCILSMNTPENIVQHVHPIAFELDTENPL